MEKVKTVALTQSVAVAVLGANSARKGYKIENLATSDAVLVRGYAAPVLATVTGVAHIRFSATPTGGSFKIRFTDRFTGATVTTAAIAAGASNATVQTAVRLLTGYGSITVGNPDSGIGYKLTLTGAPVPDARLSVVDSTLAVAGVAEVQTLSIPNEPGSDTPASGTFKVRLRKLVGKVEQVLESAALAYDASVATIQAALRRAFLDESLTVTGTAWSDSRVVTFGTVGAQQALEVVSTMRNAGDDETQTVEFSAVPDDGEFKLQFNGVKSTAIASSANAAAVQTALRTIDDLAAVTVSGDFDAGFVVTFTGVTGNAPLLVVTDNTLKEATTTEVQTITFPSAPEAGQFKLQYGATKTAFIAFDDDATAVQTALRAISGLGAVTVTGDFASGFEVTFTGEAGDLDLLVVTDNTLTVAGDTEVQLLTFPDAPAAGAYKLNYDGNASASIDWDSTAAEIQTILRAVTGLDAVTVDDYFGPPGGDNGFMITFDGVYGAAELLTVSDNTLVDGGAAPVTPDVTVDIPGTTDTVTPVVAEDTAGVGVDIDVTPSQSLAGGTKDIQPSVARTTPGVAAVDVTDTVSTTTSGDLKALAATVAGSATLDQSASEHKSAVYVVTEATGVSVKVTEVF